MADACLLDEVSDDLLLHILLHVAQLDWTTLRSVGRTSRRLHALAEAVSYTHLRAHETLMNL
eukprot:6887503-Prymnesium_polylepis.1